MAISIHSWTFHLYIFFLYFWFDQVRQMGFELHHGDGDAPEPDLVRRRLAVVQQLEDAGMVRFALRPNVFWKMPLFGVEDHNLYELAWYNRRLRRSDA